MQMVEWDRNSSSKAQKSLTLAYVTSLTAMCIDQARNDWIQLVNFISPILAIAFRGMIISFVISI
jgi:hypothetical protein